MQVEDSIEHRLFFCPSDNYERLKFHENIKKFCGEELTSYYLQLGTHDKILWVLGDGVLNTWGQDCYRAFDKCTKLFLVAIYPSIKDRAYNIMHCK